MDLAWNPLGAAGLVVGILSCVLAGLVWGARPGHQPNRLLATYLFASGLYMAVGNGLRLFAVDARDAYALIVAGSAANAIAIGALVAFVASLDSPLVGWMRRFGVRWVVAALFGAMAVDVVLRPKAHMPGVQALPGFSGWAITSSPLRGLILLVFIAVFVFAAAPALHAWRRARTRLLRRQAAIFAAAFVASSVGWAAFLVWFLAFGTLPLTPAIVVTNFVWQAANSLVLTLGLTYGILKTQLFDIDLKLKWTLRRGTVVAIFVAVFFIAVQVVKGFLGQSLGWLFGSISAAILVLALRPIERAAERLSDRAMPKVAPTPAYKTFRKMEVYKAALEELTVGGVSPKERRALDSLRTKLGIAAGDAAAMERAVKAAA